MRFRQLSRSYGAPGVSWWGWSVPTLVQLAVVAVTGMIFLWIAVLESDRAD